MREKIKRFVPVPVWQFLKVAGTALGLRRTHVMLTPHDIGILEKWARGKRSLAEIGVFEGGSAVVLRRVMDPSATLTCIDPYVVTEAGMQGSLAISKMVIGRIKRGRVRFIRDFSHKVAQTWNESLDFLFIDGNHTEEACRVDFEDWERFVTRDGVILFHDSRLDQPPVQELMGAEGSTEVVKKLFRLQKHPRWQIVDEGGSIVVIQRI